jgi:hypothetical protein
MTWIKGQAPNPIKLFAVMWDLRTLMDDVMKSKILDLLDRHRVMTIATE